ncbi:hypothetical protein O181_084398 [Austropuccinia psidii MF-1]|uniref:Uncharacterized protein n=1 Tax=Austropuccinia psidii MF-1 TaxID=1389203 RepID=A0A9Q3FR88_9BASI|nr:hypothetical protein [Austropuccinia psidii MF-1]
MLTSEVLEDFYHTKEACFVHIRVLWACEQIESAAESKSAANIISEKEVQTLRDARAGQKKNGKHIIYLEDFYFHYICSLLSRIGIRIWAPNLEEAPGFLYNKACRTIALMTFRQLACSGAYQYMRANLSYLNRIDLLHRTYDHFVHYLMTEKFKKENKQAGKNLLDDKKRVTQQRRQRLLKSRYRFAVAHNYPKRYLTVLEDINAHSDDEFIPKFKSYAIKKLCYRSESANLFFRGLDRKMTQNNKILGKPPPRHPRCRPIVPIPSQFMKAPKGMPLDFYSPDWFNQRDYSERLFVANSRQVAFIPTDIEMSNETHPDERIHDKAFNQKYWEVVSQPYDLLHEIAYSSDEQEDDDDESEVNQYSDGDVIDLGESESEESDEENVENSEEGHVQWTPDVDDEMADAFDNPPGENINIFFEEQLGPELWK